MSIELITKILDSKILSDREKQVLLSIYRLQYKQDVKKVNSSCLAKYTSTKLDTMCRFVRGLQEKNYIKRATPRASIEINWSALS